jgi:hypothetical protein
MKRRRKKARKWLYFGLGFALAKTITKASKTKVNNNYGKLTYC